MTRHGGVVKPRRDELPRVPIIGLNGTRWNSSLRALAAILWAAAAAVSAADGAGPESIPPLRPPRGEISPTFWEQYGVWVVLGGVLLAAVLGVAIWFLVRPKPPEPVPPQAAARRALESLSQQPEDGALLTRVSQVLRRYFAAAFGLPEVELNTTEFCRALAGNDQLGPELSTAVADFMRECDRRKFAPAPPAPQAPPLHAVSQALALVETAEARRVPQVAPPALSAAGASTANSNP